MRNYLLAWRIGIAAVALFAFGAPGRAELDFQFEFDATPDDGVTPPIVGTGMLELATDPGDGTFAYGALSPTYTFSFDTGDTFTQADLASDPGRVLLVISSVPGGRRIQFTDTGTGGGGPAGGSLDLVNMAGYYLSFEPSYFGGSLNLYILGRPGPYFGSYIGTTAVPEPSGLALLGSGALGLIGLALRRRRGSRPSLVGPRA